MPIRRLKTWVVVADGARARVLINEGPGSGLKPALDHEFVEAETHRHARDVKSDRPGRAFDTGSGQRHAMEPHHDPHAWEKRQFARTVARLIDDHAGRPSFDRLILVAPPRVLGDLRVELPRRAAARVVHELDKDLTHAPLSDIADHLRDVLKL